MSCNSSNTLVNDDKDTEAKQHWIAEVEHHVKANVDDHLRKKMWA